MGEAIVGFVTSPKGDDFDKLNEEGVRLLEARELPKLTNRRKSSVEDRTHSNEVSSIVYHLLRGW
jgi:hypothetical protein